MPSRNVTETAASYRAFLSYSQPDLEFVRNLWGRLTRDGVKCFFDKEDIPGGAGAPKAIQKALENSEDLVVVLSPDYLVSEWTEEELSGFMVAVFGRRPGRILPILCRDLQDMGELPLFLASRQLVNCTTAEKFETAYPGICQQMGGTPTLPVNGRQSARGMLPPLPTSFPGPFFLDRPCPFGKDA